MTLLRCRALALQRRFLCLAPISFNEQCHHFVVSEDRIKGRYFFLGAFHYVNDRCLRQPRKHSEGRFVILRTLKRRHRLLRFCPAPSVPLAISASRPCNFETSRPQFVHRLSRRALSATQPRSHVDSLTRSSRPRAVEFFRGLDLQLTRGRSLFLQKPNALKISHRRAITPSPVLVVFVDQAIYLFLVVSQRFGVLEAAIEIGGMGSAVSLCNFARPFSGVQRRGCWLIDCNGE